jgi:hypothetical protein
VHAAASTAPSAAARCCADGASAAAAAAREPAALESPCGRVHVPLRAPVIGRVVEIKARAGHQLEYRPSESPESWTGDADRHGVSRYDGCSVGRQSCAVRPTPLPAPLRARRRQRLRQPPPQRLPKSKPGGLPRSGSRRMSLFGLGQAPTVRITKQRRAATQPLGRRQATPRRKSAVPCPAR